MWRARDVALRGASVAPVGPGDVAAGLRLTGHFLNRWIFEPDGKEIPFARQRLADLTGNDHG